MPGNADDRQPFDLIAPGETINLTGTEPFWGGEIAPEGAGWTLRWSTPENIAGERVTMERFAGRGGLAFSGTLAGEGLDLAITPADCSDGMSDRTYPYAVTVTLGDQQLDGCGWTEARPYTGGE